MTARQRAALLALPDDVKASHDVSHVKYIVHGAAPCPPEVKQAMIDWFGPIVNEYYAGSEGGAGFTITDFAAFAEKEQEMKDATSWPDFDAVPVEFAKRMLRAKVGMLNVLRAAKEGQ